MATIHLFCGMICSGKTILAGRLQRETSAFPLSVDELMLSLFEPYMGDAYAPMLEKATAYLYRQAERLLDAGVDVTLDFGFWTPESRRDARARFERAGHRVLLHYLPIESAEWERRVDRRNAEVAAGKRFVYSLDANMRRTFPSRFVPPAPEEYDVLEPNAPFPED